MSSRRWPGIGQTDCLGFARRRTTWTDCGIDETYGTKEVNDLTVYNGKLYAGTIPRAEVYRYEGGAHWSFVKRLVNRSRGLVTNGTKTYAKPQAPPLE